MNEPVFLIILASMFSNNDTKQRCCSEYRRTSPVDVLGFEVNGLANPGTCRVCGHQNHFVFEVVSGADDLPNILFWDVAYSQLSPIDYWTQ